MKLTTLRIATFGICGLIAGLIGSASAAPQVAGTEMGVDFGPTPPTNNFNDAPANNGSVAAGALVDTAGTVVDGVSVAWSSSGWSNNDSATESDLPGQPAQFNDSNLTDWIGKNNTGVISITFAGLDDSLDYTLIIGSGFIANATNVDTRWTVDSQTADTDHGVGANAYVTLTGLSTDGSGNLVMTGTGITNNISCVSALHLVGAVGVPDNIWQVDGNGNWNDAANWSLGIPNAAEAQAVFDDTLPLTGALTATLDVPVTLGELIFGSAQAITIDGVNALTFDSVGSADVSATAGSHEISADVVLSDPLDATLAVGSSLGLSGALSGASNLTLKGSGDLTLSGNLAGFTGGLISEGGDLEVPSGNTATDLFRMNTKKGGHISLAGTVTLANNASFGVGSGIQGTTGSLTVESGGELNIGAASGYTGIGGGDVFATRTQSGNGTLTIVAGGTLNVDAPGANNGGLGGLDSTNFWMNPYGSGGGTSTINLDGGLLSTQRQIQRGSTGNTIFNFNGGTLQAAASTAGALLSNMTRVNVRDGGGTIDTQAFDITHNQILDHSDLGGDAAIDGGLTKLGSGTLTLGGVNTYTGPTTVSEGTLGVTGSLTSDVSVADGAAISGEGSTTGSLTLGATTGGGIVLAPAAFTGVEVVDLTLNGVTELTLPGGVSPFVVATYSGILTDGNGGTLDDSFTVAGARSVSITDTAGLIEATVDTESGIWTGTTSGNWQLGGPDANWDTSDSFFFTGDEAVFDDSGANKIVSLTANVAPGYLEVFNSAGNDYTFTGAFAIAGGVELIKDGDGALIVDNDNTFSGGTSVFAGTLQVGSGGTTGNLGVGAIVNDGLVILNRSDDLTLPNSISGFGSVVKDGPNTVTLGVPMPYMGSTTVAAGVLNLPLNDHYGNHVGSDLDLTIEAGAVVTNGTTAGYNAMELLTLNGGELRATNDLSVGGGTADFYQAYGLKTLVTVGGITPSSITDLAQPNGAISIGLNGSVLPFDVADVTGDASTDLTVSAKLKNPPGGTAGLTKTGAGTMVMTRTNVYTGATTVSAGTLSLGDGTNDTNLADAADVDLTTGVTLNLNYVGTDTIAVLYIDGADQALGTWGRIGSGADNESALITGDGLLEVTVVVGTPYSIWADGFAGLLDSTSTLDFEGDGLPTGTEYVLGGDPTLNDAASISPTQSVDATDLIFVFRRSDLAAGDPNTAIAVEYGSDLQGWSPAVDGLDGVLISFVDDGGGVGIDLVTVRIPRALAVDGKLFARLNVTVTIP